MNDAAAFALVIVRAEITVLDIIVLVLATVIALVLLV